MSQIAQTTKIHRKGAPAQAELDMEAMALVKRVSERLKQPTPTAPQEVVKDDYEPQDVVPKAQRPKR